VDLVEVSVQGQTGNWTSGEDSHHLVDAKCVVPQILDVGMGLSPVRLVVNEDGAVGDGSVPYLRNGALSQSTIVERKHAKAYYMAGA